MRIHESTSHSLSAGDLQVWGAAEINLGYELSEDHKRVLLLVLQVCCVFKGDISSARNKVAGPFLTDLGTPFQSTIWLVIIRYSFALNHRHRSRLPQDNTMLVQGQRSFSHEEFRGVVYSKYIQSPETMVRLHIQMARYFARLPASDRKVGGPFGRRMLMLLLCCLRR